MTKPTCFIVYAHGENHSERDKEIRQKIDRIIHYLKDNGVSVISDRESGNAGQSIADFNERINIHHEDAMNFVILVGTPELRSKYERGMQIESQTPFNEATLPVVYKELKMIYRRIVIEDELVKTPDLGVSRTIIPLLLDGTKAVWPPFVRVEKQLVYVDCNADPAKTLEQCLDKALQTIKSQKNTTLEQFRRVKEVIRGISPEKSEKTLLQVHRDSMELKGNGAVVKIRDTLPASMEHTVDRLTLRDHASDLHIIASSDDGQLYEESVESGNPGPRPSLVMKREVINASGHAAVMRIGDAPPAFTAHNATEVNIDGNASDIDFTSASSSRGRLRRSSDDGLGKGV